MQNQWNDSHAKTAIEQYNNVSKDIALRVYTSKLIGIDPALVLHGGGNTSVNLSLKMLSGKRLTSFMLREAVGTWTP